MILYLFVAFWPIVVGQIARNRTISMGNIKFNSRKYLILSLLPIIFLLAFRGGEMGADAGTYVRHFERIIETPINQIFLGSRMEHGYLIFAKLISYVTHSGLVYQIICIIFEFIGLFCWLKDENTDECSLFLYFYCALGLFFFMFTGVRQCLAMSICLISFVYAKKKKYVPFALCIVIAFFFHKSAILFVAVLIVMNLKICLRNVIAYLLGSIIAGRYLNNIQAWFNDTLEYSYEIENTGSGIIFLLVLAFLTIFSLILLYNEGILSDINSNCDLKEYKQLININFITIFFWIMRLQTRVAERPSFYFMFFSCMLFAKSLASSTDKNKKIYVLLIVGLTALLYIYRLRTNFAGLIPYRFY